MTINFTTKFSKECIEIYDNGFCVGYVIYSTNYAKKPYVAGLYVNPKYRRMGIGSLLLKRLKDKYDYIELMATPEYDKNSPVSLADLHQFYMRNGFVYDETSGNMIWEANWFDRLG